LLYGKICIKGKAKPASFSNPGIRSEKLKNNLYEKSISYETQKKNNYVMG
jgi:hypothetical protein